MYINQYQNKFFKFLLDNYCWLQRKDDNKIEGVLTIYIDDFEREKMMKSYLSQKFIYKINGIYYKFSYKVIESGGRGFKIIGEIL